MKTITIRKAVKQRSYKHVGSGGGGSYERTVIPVGAVVQVFHESEAGVVVKYKNRSYSLTHEDVQ